MPSKKIDRSKECEVCGQAHGRCRGHNRAGKPCGKHPVPGLEVCVNHGGKTPAAQLAAQRRLEQGEVERQLNKALSEAYGQGVPHVDPAEAMLQAVSWKHAEVLALRSIVATLEYEDRTWGVRRKKYGGEDHGTTMETRTNIWTETLDKAMDAMVRYSAAARAAGCDEARVRLAEDQGRMVAVTMQGFAADLLAFNVRVLEKAHPEALQLLVDGWALEVRQRAAERLRSIAVSGEPVAS